MAIEKNRRSFITTMMAGAVMIPSSEILGTFSQLKLEIGNRKILLIADEYAAQLPNWLWADMGQKLGVESVQICHASPQMLVKKVPQLLREHSDKICIFMVPNMVLPELFEAGLMSPLHPKVKSSESFGRFWQGVAPSIRHYCQAPYEALPIDGDVMSFHVRASAFPNGAPETWHSLMQYLDGQGSEKNQLALSQSWLSYFGLWGSIYGSFCAQRSPFLSPQELEHPALVESLRVLKAITEKAQLLDESAVEEDLVKLWTRGENTVYFGFSSLVKGFNRYAGGRESSANDTVFARFPGVANSVGVVGRTPLALWGRSLVIPKISNDQDWHLASQLAFTLVKPEISRALVGDAKNGIDPFHSEHFSEASIAMYEKSGSNLMAPFHNRTGISRFLEASKANLRDSIPQPHWYQAYQLMVETGSRLRNGILADSPTDLANRIASTWNANLPR